MTFADRGRINAGVTSGHILRENEIKLLALAVQLFLFLQQENNEADTSKEENDIDCLAEFVEWERVSSSYEKKR